MEEAAVKIICSSCFTKARFHNVCSKPEAAVISAGTKGSYGIQQHSCSSACFFTTPDHSVRIMKPALKIPRKIDRTHGSSNYALLPAHIPAQGNKKQSACGEKTEMAAFATRQTCYYSLFVTSLFSNFHQLPGQKAAAKLQLGHRSRFRRSFVKFTSNGVLPPVGIRARMWIFPS